MCSARAASVLSCGEAAIFRGRCRTYGDGRSSRFSRWVDGFVGTVLTGPWSGFGYLLTRGSELAGAGVPGAHQIRTDVLAAADQITQLLTLDRRDCDQHRGLNGFVT